MVLLNDLAGGRTSGIASTERERAEVQAVIQKLERMGPRVPLEIQGYRRWAPRVACLLLRLASSGSESSGRGETCSGTIRRRQQFIVIVG
jgi:hypothetical protein